MKYEINAAGAVTVARNGFELDSYVQEALSWGIKPSDIVITVVVENSEQKS